MMRFRARLLQGIVFQNKEIYCGKNALSENWLWENNNNDLSELMFFFYCIVLYFSKLEAGD